MATKTIGKLLQINFSFSLVIVLHCLALSYDFQLEPGRARGRATQHFQSHAVSTSYFFSDILNFQVPCFYVVCGGVARRAGVILVYNEGSVVFIRAISLERSNSLNSSRLVLSSVCLSVLPTVAFSFEYHLSFLYLFRFVLLQFIAGYFTVFSLYTEAFRFLVVLFFVHAYSDHYGWLQLIRPTAS